LNRFIEQIKTFYAELDEVRRRMLVGGLLAGILAVGATTWWASQEVYVPLLSGSPVDQVRRVAGALETGEVPYRISSDGGRLDVPQQHMGKAWVLAASVDVLPSISDVAAMPKVLTPGQQDWAFNRAREGDIARMINQIHSVAATRVTIVPREEGTYFGEERPASASVLIRTVTAASLTQQQIRGITNLVANSVDGLESDGVTLVDDKGTLLASGAKQEDLFGEGDAGKLLEYKIGVEQRLASSVGRALSPVLGNTTDFSVTATVELDLISRETVSLEINVDRQAVMSEQVEESTQINTATGGVPGVNANLPERGGAKGLERSAGKDESAESLGSTFNYAYPTVEQVSRSSAGGVERLSVAVQINQERIVSLVKSKNPEASEEEIQVEVEVLQAQLEEAVKTAVGFKEGRDQVEVSFLPFSEVALVEATGTSVVSASEWMRYGIAALGLVLFFAFVVRPVIAKLPEAAKPKPSKKKLAAVAARGGAGGVGGDDDDELSDDEDLASRLRNLVDNYQAVTADDLNMLVEREAEAAAQVIRLWTRHG
jgi:flagellar M-ring protein FliF